MFVEILSSICMMWDAWICYHLQPASTWDLWRHCFIKKVWKDCFRQVTACTFPHLLLLLILPLGGLVPCVVCHLRLLTYFSTGVFYRRLVYSTLHHCPSKVVLTLSLLRPYTHTGPMFLGLLPESSSSSQGCSCRDGRCQCKNMETASLTLFQSTGLLTY